MLVKIWLNFYSPEFNNRGNKNCQMYKLDSQEAQAPRITLVTSGG